MYINQMSYGYNHNSNLKGVHIHKKEMKKIRLYKNSNHDNARGLDTSIIIQ